eukprot:CCRYP_016148-RB/>CCRYP_016148-RB protein AED:0.01 eAED:0.01 QI:153/1/1/1/0.14/0.12/8/2051/850
MMRKVASLSASTITRVSRNLVDFRTIRTSAPSHDDFWLYGKSSSIGISRQQGSLPPARLQTQRALSRNTSTQTPSLERRLQRTKVETDMIFEREIPFRRSKGKDGNQSVLKRNTKLMDTRAEAKLQALSEAKVHADIISAKYFSQRQSGHVDADMKQLNEELSQCQHHLAQAYSQAIKYSSRIPNNPEATSVAETLLYEWMGKVLTGFRGDDSKAELHDGETASESAEFIMKNATMKKKLMVRTVHGIIPTLRSEHDARTQFSLDEKKHESMTIHNIPPPTSKDYINVLRAYSISKARRKGEQAEALIVNMLDLAETLAKCNDDAHNDLYTSWIKESIPNSKMFALTIKCYGGSTHKDSLDKIYLLNEVHDEFAQCCKDLIPGIFINDPYVLLHSIKALRNLQIEEERKKGWLTKLHEFVTDPNNKDYFVEEDKVNRIDSNINTENDEQVGSDFENASNPPDGNVGTDPNDMSSKKSSQIDVTSAYVTLIRLLARLRGEKSAASDARSILDRMHEVHKLMMIGSNDVDGTTNSIAFIDIRSNAYNLVLGLYKDSKNGEDATKAVELLGRMVDAGKKEEEERDGVPLPTHQSFEYAILSLAKMNDSSAAFKEAERLIALMEETEYLDRSVIVYNALLTLCSKVLYDKHELYDKAMDIFGKLNETTKLHSALAPTPETMSLVIKACALSQREDHEVVFGTATKIFSELIAQENDERSSLVVTDSCYYHMMRCTMAHMPGDAETRKERLEELFSQACRRGLCSSAILTFYRNNTSEEDYRLTVGQGRLADSWIANVTSPRALYTDGSSRGAGKNARRAGKSTSNWAKKQQLKEAQRKVNKDSKRVKKMLKNLQ